MRHEAIVVDRCWVHSHVGNPVHGRDSHKNDPVQEDYSANEEHKSHSQSINDIQHGVTLLVGVQKPSHIDKESGGFCEESSIREYSPVTTIEESMKYSKHCNGVVDVVFFGCL